MASRRGPRQQLQFRTSPFSTPRCRTPLAAARGRSVVPRPGPPSRAGTGWRTGTPPARHMIPCPCISLPPASIGPLISAQSAALISCLLINELGPVRLLSGTFAHRFDSAIADLLRGEQLRGFARSQTGGMRWERGVNQPGAAGTLGCSRLTSTRGLNKCKGIPSALRTCIRCQ